MAAFVVAGAFVVGGIVVVTGAFVVVGSGALAVLESVRTHVGKSKYRATKRQVAETKKKAF